MKTIYYNGCIYTGVLPLQEAMVVEDDKFIYVGNSNEAKQMIDADTKVVDLDGKFVCSSFNDSHMHLLNYGYALRSAELSKHTHSLNDMIQCLKEFKSSDLYKEGAWILGRGWNHDYYSDVKRMPTRWDLDKVDKDTPICAVRACGHCLVVNSKVIEMLGITADTEQPDGGHIGMQDNEPNGLFFDNAMDIVFAAIPVPDKNDIKEMILSACKALNSYGVTSSQTDDYCVFRKVPWNTVNEAYRELEEEGKLTVRVYMQSNFTNLTDLKEFVESGNVTGIGSNMFKIGPLKMLGDGALGSRTAYLSRVYADDASTCGIPIFTQSMFDEMIGYANEHNMQVAVHTIGDACLDLVLNSYEKALNEHPRDDHRHGIVHCQITRPEQLDKIAQLKLHVYAQSIFLDYDNHIIEQRVGKELASSSYSWKTLMDKGVTVSNGTDCPVELPDAMACMQCAVTRTTLHDNVGPYLPEQAFTVKEALDSYTIEGAKGSFEENIKGQIKNGMLADFVVLGENPFNVQSDMISQIPVEMTFIGGKCVYSR